MSQESTRQQDLAGHAAGSLVWICAALLLWQRLHLGIDFTDESIYVGIAVSFFRDGIRLFVDEVNFSSSGAVLVAPFLSFAGDLNEGIVLYVRKLFFAFVVVQSIVIYFCVAHLIRPRFAWVVCAIPLSFVPHGIPSLSYNTMGTGLLLLATMLAWRAAFARGRVESGLAALSGALFGLGGLAHPAFGLAGLCSCALNVVAAGPGNRRFGVFQATGFMAGAIAGYAMLRMPEVAAVWDSIQYMHSIGSGTGAGVMHKIRIMFGGGLEPLRYFTVEDTRRSLAVWNLMFLLLVPLMFLLPGAGDARRRAVILRVVVPSCMTGLILAYTSGNGILNWSIATLPATIAGAVWLARWVEGRASRALPWGVFLLLTAVLAASTYASRSPYRDGPLAMLNYPVESGPFRGLLTTSVKHEFLKEIDADRMALKQTAPDAKHVLFFDRFPAGYLLVPLTPCTDTLWHFPAGRFPNLDRARTLRAFKARQCEPDVVFVMHRIPYQVGVFDKLLYPETDVLHAFIDGGARYSKWKESAAYSIYLKRADPR